MGFPQRRTPEDQAGVAPSSLGAPEISVVIPALNEGGNIGSLVSGVRRVLGELVSNFEIIVVDGGSSDETWKEAESAGAQCMLQRRLGYGGALRDGFLTARGDFIITLDSDLSHPPELMRELWKLRGEADVIIGSRFVPGGSSAASAFRHTLSIILNFIFSTTLSVPIKDSSSGYRLYRREVLKPEVYRPENFNILQEVLIRAFIDGWRVREVPLQYQERGHGESHVSLVKFACSYVPTLARLWILRNSPIAADYEARAFNSRHLLQRYWIRRRVALIKALLGSPAGRVIDIGCGSSPVTSSDPEIVALDLRADKLRYLRDSNKSRVQGRIEELPYKDGSFSGAVVSHVLGYPEVTSVALRELNRILAIGGTVVVAIPDNRRLSWKMIRFLYNRLPNVRRTRQVQREFSRSFLVDLLAEHGFRSLKYRYILGSELVLKAQKVAEYQSRDSTSRAA